MEEETTWRKAQDGEERAQRRRAFPQLTKIAYIAQERVERERERVHSLFSLLFYLSILFLFN